MTSNPQPKVPFEQPALDDNMSRVIPLKNDEIKKPYRAYAVIELSDGRFGAIQVTIDNNKVIAIRGFGHLEVEKEFAEHSLIKTLNYEEKMRL